MSAGKDCAYIDLISFPCGRLNSEMGIEDYVQEASWYSVWPNPATETVHIQMDATDNRGNSYQLFDMSGKLIQGGRLTDNISEIDIRSLVAGTYLLKVESSNRQAQTTKIVKK
jgi:hypothetical protein